MKTVLIIVAIVAVVGLGYAAWQEYNKPKIEPEQIVEQLPVQNEEMPPVEPSVVPGGSDPGNTSYTIEGQVVTLVDGTAETPAAPGSATMIITTMFGEPTMGELNGDGFEDAAVMLVQDMGGSGTFYYQAAAIAQGDGFIGTNAELLGDRIAPQTTQVADQTIIANYAERAEGEPMTAQPSMMVSKYFQVVGTTLTEIANPNVPQGQM